MKYTNFTFIITLGLACGFNRVDLNKIKQIPPDYDKSHSFIRSYFHSKPNPNATVKGVLYSNVKKYGETLFYDKSKTLPNS